MFGTVVVGVAILLLLWSNSKTAFGLALIIPCLAGLTLFTAKSTRISPAILRLSIPFCYTVLSIITGFSMNRVSYWLYGDLTFTGRTLIWDFANYEIAQKPLLGWGYQSFWLVGSGDAPSAVEAPGWIKGMPNAHNGYIDTTLEMGYVGYYLLLIFITATLHAIGRLAYREAARAWLLLSLALYIICYNYLEMFMDARLRIFVGDVFDCCCRSWSILASNHGGNSGPTAQGSKLSRLWMSNTVR